MATSTAQRTGIWIITLAMIIGTVVGFVVMIMSSQDQTKQQKAMQDYSAAYADYQKKVTAQTADLSKQYYDTFVQYASTPAAFDAASVKEVTTEDVKVGDGDTKIAVYYIGWNPTGKVFDKSIDDTTKSLKQPFDPSQSIPGFKKGVEGLKAGGVRIITIPSDQAYKDQGSGADIPPNTPLRFLVMAIPQPATIPQPALTQDVINAYAAQQQ